VSVDLGALDALPGPIGTFTDTTNLFASGAVSGVVLSTGAIGELFTGALGTTGVNHGRSPDAGTASLLAQIPGGGSGFFDPVRFTLAIDPGLTANFINFDLAFGTNELGLTTDRVGIFVNDVYYGLLAFEPLGNVTLLHITDVHGNVVQGPPSVPLQTYPVEVAEGQVVKP